MFFLSTMAVLQKSLTRTCKEDINITCTHTVFHPLVPFYTFLAITQSESFHVFLLSYFPVYSQQMGTSPAVTCCVFKVGSLLAFLLDLGVHFSLVLLLRL